MSKKDDEIMTRMKMIIANESKAYDEFANAQKKYLNELKQMEAAIKKGQQVDTSSVRKILQDSGIIDKNGNITKRYKKV